MIYIFIIKFYIIIIKVLLYIFIHSQYNNIKVENVLLLLRFKFSLFFKYLFFFNLNDKNNII